ncbi:hypothetical protein SLE2022_236000 [Rubroshorea leprosula]
MNTQKEEIEEESEEEKDETHPNITPTKFPVPLGVESSISQSYRKNRNLKREVIYDKKTKRFGNQSRLETLVRIKEQIISTNGIWLDLDCVTNLEKAISDWAQATWIAVANKNWNALQIVRFIEVTFKGIVHDWFAGLNEEDSNVIISGNPTSKEVNENEAIQDIINRFESAIRREFLGENWEENQGKEEARIGRIAMWNLHNLELCNLYELD